MSTPILRQDFMISSINDHDNNYVTPPTSYNSKIMNNDDIYNYSSQLDASSSNTLKLINDNDSPIDTSVVIDDDDDDDDDEEDIIETIVKREHVIVQLLRKLCSVVDPTQKMFNEYYRQLHEADLIAYLPEDANEINNEIVSPKSNIHTISTSRYKRDFTDTKQIGRGSFGKVYKAKHVIDNVIYAIKVIQFKQRLLKPKKMLREVTCLAKLDHPNIIRYYNAWIEQNDDNKHKIQRSKSMNIVSKNHVIIDANHFSLERCTSDPIPNHMNKPKAILTTSITTKLNQNDDEIDNPGTPKRQSINGHLPPPPALLNNSISSDEEEIGDSINSMDYSLESLLSPNASSTELKFPELSPNITIKKTPARPIPKVNKTNIVNNEMTPLRNFHFDNNNNNNNNNDGSKTERSERKRKTSKKQQQHQRFKLYIQMQLCDGPRLTDWLTSKERRQYDISPNINMPIIYQILCGLHHIHQQGVMHRDLKPDNLFVTLLNNSNNDHHQCFEALAKAPDLSAVPYLIKIGDFGLAKDYTDEAENDNVDFKVSTIKGKHHGEKRTGNLGVGTVTYSSPEQISGQLYSTKSDIYSLGVIMYELYHDFSTGMERAVCLTNARKGNISEEFIQKFPNESKIIESMLNHKTQQRPSAIELLNHPYIQKFANVSSAIQSPLHLLRKNKSVPPLSLPPAKSADKINEFKLRSELKELTKQQLIDKIISMSK